MKKLFFSCLALLFLLTSCESRQNEKVTIAIVTPITHPSLEQAERGFIQTLEELHPGKCQFVTYNAQGNKTLMRSEIEEIVQKRVDLVFTLGTSASQMAKEVFVKKGIVTPIVFTCVNDPVGFKIVGDSITGVVEMLHFDAELEALLSYKPEIKKLLVVYNPAEPGLQKDIPEIQRLLKGKGIELVTLEVYQTNELLSKVSNAMPTVDAVVVLKDNTVVSALDVLVKLCDSFKVPLMASDLDSPDRGAAFGYGVYEVAFGQEAAKKASQILFSGISPKAIPVTPVSEFHLRVNEAAAKRQGIVLP